MKPKMKPPKKRTRRKGSRKEERGENARPIAWAPQENVLFTRYGTTSSVLTTVQELSEMDQQERNKHIASLTAVLAQINGVPLVLKLLESIGRLDSSLCHEVGKVIDAICANRLGKLREHPVAIALADSYLEAANSLPWHKEDAFISAVKARIYLNPAAAFKETTFLPKPSRKRVIALCKKHPNWPTGAQSGDPVKYCYELMGRLGYEFWDQVNTLEEAIEQVQKEH